METDMCNDSYKRYSYEIQPLSDGTAELLSFKSDNTTELVIPGTIEGYKISRIARFAFYGTSDTLTKITISEGVNEIDAFAFVNCPGNISVFFPNSVRQIDFLLWSFNRNIKLVIRPDHPTLRMIDGVLFDKINNCLLYYPGWKTDTSYCVPDGVLSIGKRAFYENKVLLSIILPDSLTEIGESSFAGCVKLREINLPANVLKIEYEAFRNCESLEEVVLPTCLKNIEDKAFFGCKNIVNVVVGELTEESLINAFSSSEALASIRVISPHGTLITIDGVLFDKTRQRLLLYPRAKKEQTYKIPDCTISIAPCAFSGQQVLKEVFFPESICDIERGAFSGCEKLRLIRFDENCRNVKIGKHAFKKCGIKLLDLHAVSVVEKYAFEDCPVEEILFGNNNTVELPEFEDGVFGDFKRKSNDPISLIYCDNYIRYAELMRLFKPWLYDSVLFLAKDKGYRLSGNNHVLTVDNICSDLVYAPNLLIDDIKNRQLSLEEYCILIDYFIQHYCHNGFIYYGYNEFISWVSKVCEFEGNEPKYSSYIDHWYDCNSHENSVAKSIFEKYYYEPLEIIIENISDIWTAVGTDSVVQILGREKCKKYVYALYAAYELCLSTKKDILEKVNYLLADIYCYENKGSIVTIEKNGMILVHNEQRLIKVFGRCDVFSIDGNFSVVAKHAFGSGVIINTLQIHGPICIEEEAFWGSRIEAVELECIESVQSRQFADMHHLKDIYIKNGCRRFEENAFVRASQLFAGLIDFVNAHRWYKIKNPMITVHIENADFDKGSLENAIVLYSKTEEYRTRCGGLRDVIESQQYIIVE